jgi:hypothetical protein
MNRLNRRLQTLAYLVSMIMIFHCLGCAVWRKAIEPNSQARYSVPMDEMIVKSFKVTPALREDVMENTPPRGDILLRVDPLDYFRSHGIPFPEGSWLAFEGSALVAANTRYNLERLRRFLERNRFLVGYDPWVELSSKRQQRLRQMPRGRHQ